MKVKQNTVARLNVIGSTHYGAWWPFRRQNLVTGVTGNRTDDEWQLTEYEAQRLVAGIERNMAKAQAGEA